MQKIHSRDKTKLLSEGIPSKFHGDRFTSDEDRFRVELEGRRH